MLVGLNVCKSTAIRESFVHETCKASNRTDRTVFSVVSEEGTTPVVVNFTTLVCGRYIRINMTLARLLYLTEIEVFDTSECTHRHHELTQSVSTVTNVTYLSSITDDTTSTPPSSAGGNPVSTTTSVGSSNHSVKPTCE